MNVFYLIIGLCLSLALQVCSDDEAQSHSTGLDSLIVGVSKFVQSVDSTLEELERNPIQIRSKRSADPDECHDLQKQGLPGARKAIYGAWNNSMTAVVAITTAFNDVKKCASWNIFVSVPCGIKAVVEFISSYKTYKSEIAQFFTDVKGASRNATEDFVGCAKILLAHRSKSP